MTLTVADIHKLSKFFKLGNYKAARDLLRDIVNYLEENIPDRKNRDERVTTLKNLTEYREHLKILDEYLDEINANNKIPFFQVCVEKEISSRIPKTSTIRYNTPSRKTFIRPFVGNVRRSRGLAIVSSRTRNGPSTANSSKTAKKVSEPTTNINFNNVLESSIVENDNEKKDFLEMVPKEIADILSGCLMEKGDKTSWKDIIGLEEIKRFILLNVKTAPKLKKIFRGIRKPMKKILLYGPPGTGKTLIGRAIANSCGRKFLMVTPSILTSKWRGDSEKLIKHLFDMAKAYAPSLIFFDEIDGFCMERGSKSEHEASRRSMSEFLVRFEDLNKSDDDVFVIAATNTPWDLDGAVVRRFDYQFYVPLPNIESRVNIIKKCLFEIDIEEGFNFEKIAEKLDGYSASDIVRICRRSSLKSVEDYFSNVDFEESFDFQNESNTYLPVLENDFYYYIECTPSSVSTETLKKYLEYNAR
uniref:AAA domain-containing protein n=1 Tax=Parastrongyloides trichosuri TaxID=131310 RepID=A0A0N5A5L1_PARTI